MNAHRKAMLFAACIALALPRLAIAQHAGHDSHAPQAQDPKPDATTPTATTDHSEMDHSKMGHASMDHTSMDADASAPREPIPPVTDADRAAAFPDVHAHHRHGTSVHSYWLLDRLEVADRDGGSELGWEASAWIGGDVRKLWLRSEGHAAHGQVEAGDIEVLYGQGVRAWWDVLAGVRHDLGEGPDRDWLAVGVQGLAPYKIEVAATVYLGERGRTAARLEAEYDTLLSQRLVLQWRAEAEAHGKADLARGIGAGLGTVEAGLRLRYEITRQFAPYIGFERTHAFGGTADLRRAAGTPVADDRLVAGVRIWF